jgi:hypothetical protein
MNNILVAIMASIAECQARVAGMTAENMQRQAIGHSMAYTDADFAYQADELDRLSRAARGET